MPDALTNALCTTTMTLSHEAISALSPAAKSEALRELLADKSQPLSEDLLPLFAKGCTTVHLGNSRLTDRGLGLIGASCGASLVELDLSFCTRLRDAGVISLARVCPALHKLMLAHCRLSDTAFESISHGCRELRELDCSWNGSGVTERSVRAFAAGLHRLERLAICGCRVGDDALLALACACPELRRVNTRGCDMLSEAGVVGALCSMPHVSALELCQLPRVSEPSLQLLVARARSVTSVDVSMCQRLGDECVSHAASGFENLQTLECYGLGRLQCPTIAGPQLTTLILSGCRAL